MFLTESEAAQALRIDRRTLRRLIDSGRLHAINIGSGRRRHYRVAKIALAEVSSTQPSPLQIESRRRPVRRRVATDAVSLLPAA